MQLFLLQFDFPLDVDSCLCVQLLRLNYNLPLGRSFSSLLIIFSTVSPLLPAPVLSHLPALIPLLWTEGPSLWLPVWLCEGWFC